MSATSVNDTTFTTEVLESKVPVLVDFWAPWCGPCRTMSGIVDELAEEFQTGAKVVKLNVDDATKTAQEFGIMSIPTFAVIHEGRVVSQISGVVPKENLARALREHVVEQVES